LRQWVQAHAVVPDKLRPLWQHPSLGYLVAVLGQVAAVSLTAYLGAMWPRDFPYPGVLPLVVVIVVALRWDFGPSVVGTLLGAVLISYYILRPYAAWSAAPAAMGTVLAFVAIGLTIGLLGSRAHRARSQAEAAAEARAQLTAIVKASADAIIGATLDSTITSWNPGAARLYGYRAEEVIGRPASLLYPPDRHDELPELLGRVARGESIPHFETERLRKDGTRIAVSLSVAPVRAASGAVVGSAVVAHDITERKQAEEALRESEARLGALLDAAPDASVIVDKQGLIVRVNTQAEWQFGYAREELLGRPVELLLPERFRGSHVRHRASYQDAPRARPMGRGLDLYARRKDGSEIPVEISLSPLETAEGTLVISAIRDITARKRGEADLAAELEAMTRLHDLSQRVVSAPDLQTLLDTVLEATIALHGADFGNVQLYDAQTHTLRIAAQRGFGPPFLEHFAQVSAEEGSACGRALSRGAQVIIPDVAQDPAFASDLAAAREAGFRAVQSTPLLTSTGRPLGMLSTHFRQPRRFAARELRLTDLYARLASDALATQLLAHSLQEQARLIELAHDAILVRDLASVVVQWNQGAVEMYGWTVEEARGQDAHTLLRTRFPVSRQEVERALEQSGRWEGELVHTRRDGAQIVVESRQVLVRDDAGQPAAILEINREITERRQAEQALEQSNRELARSNTELARASRVKSEFLATMSHEIRTPMNGVIGMTGLLLDTELTPEQHEYAETVRSSGEALLAIINDILDFSKIEAGRLNLEVTDCDVRRTVEEVVDLFAGEARDKGLELASLASWDVPSVLRGDPGRLRQVLTNLVSNAVKFTEHGDVVVRATLAEQTDEAALVRFAVTDTGIGMTPEERRQLFHPFSQADSSTTRKYGGTGLGLAISKRLVELMGGEIGVESEAGKGSTFWFTVRLGTATPASLTDPTAADLHGKRVLVVDDNATNRQILHDQVASWGLRNGRAATAQGALTALREALHRGAPYDVALVDLDMPGMDGLELARAIKADPALAAAKVVLLASISPRERGDTDEGWRAAIDAYLAKPVRQSQLYNCLATVLAASGGRRPAAGDRTAAPLLPVARRPSHAGRGRVLVVEDNAVSQRVAVRMLEQRGYRADAAANGREAAELLAQIPYDLVLMDCQMPEMDGYAATVEIRRREWEQGAAARRTPIIAMTANALQGDAEKCLAAGMDDYIAKPVVASHLEAVLTRWGVQAEPSVPGEAVDENTLTALRDPQGEGQPDILAEVIAVYLRDTPPRLAALHEAVARADAAALRREAHTLKGSSSQIGAMQMARLCADLEDQAGTTDLAGALETLCRLDEAFDWVRARLHVHAVLRPADRE
jgi:PAS domain S-box-containing protein